MTGYQARCTVVGMVATLYLIELGFFIRFLVEGRYG